MSPVTFEVLDKPTRSWIVYRAGTRSFLGYVWHNAKGWWSHVGDGRPIHGPFDSRIEAGSNLLPG